MWKPQLLGYSVEANMEPKLDWLQTRLDLDEAQLRKMVLTLPALLSYSVETNMAPKLAYLERETGLSRSELRDRVLRFPQFMSYSLEKRYRPRLEACRAAGVDASFRHFSGAHEMTAPEIADVLAFLRRRLLDETCA